MIITLWQMGQAVKRYEGCSEFVRTDASTVRFKDAEGKWHLTSLDYEVEYL